MKLFKLLSEGKKKNALLILIFCVVGGRGGAELALSVFPIFWTPTKSLGFHKKAS